MHCLAADIGGTKTHLALYRDSVTQRIKEKKFASQEYDSFQNILKEFLQDISVKIDIACIAIAGPIVNQTCRTTNLPWTIEADQLKQVFHFPFVVLLNDLEAQGYGIQALSKEEFLIINKGKPVEKKPRAIIAAGTGLGEAGAVWGNNQYHLFASEGGHVDFSPRNEREIELLRFLIKKYKHVSWERVLSGPGIYELYLFLVEKENKEVSKEVLSAFKHAPPQDVITEFGVKNKDRLCVEIIDWFLSLYGCEAGNLALKYLPLNGLFIGGGIVLNLLDKIKEKNFIKAFLDKGRFARVLQDIPVKIILNGQCALTGAAYYGFQTKNLSE